MIMNLLTKFSKKITLYIAGIFAIALLSLGHVAAIPYSGDSTPPTSGPQFNAFTGVPSEGVESDFFRGKVAGSTTASTNVVESTCENGKQFTLRVYVHNGATETLNGNGDGVSVAKNTRVKVNLNNSSAKTSFNPDATISASNAASVNDGMVIKCSDGKVVKLSYVDNTATQFSRTGTKPIDDDALFTTGALVGTDQPDGNVWGCWTQRVYVTFNVQVKEVEEPKPTPSYECKVTDVKVDDVKTRKVTATVNGTAANGAKIVGYKIEWGDGSSSNKQTDSHTYAKDGSYTIKGYVQVELPGGEKKWVNSNNCTKVVKFDNGQPVTPVTPEVPTTLPDTGAGDVLGIFTATSAAGAAAHRVFTARRKRGL
jgi:hypothetical protein